VQLFASHGYVVEFEHAVVNGNAGTARLEWFDKHLK